MAWLWSKEHCMILHGDLTDRDHHGSSRKLGGVDFCLSRRVGLSG